MSGVTVPPSSPPPSPRPRRIAPPRWLDLRLVLGVVLVLASVLIGAKVVSGARTTHPAVEVTRDLAAGKVLTARDVKLAQVQLPGRSADAYLTAVRDAVGKQLDRPVSAGELVPARAVSPSAPRTTLTVPLAAGAAPDLRTGQRIEVWVSTANCSSTVLLRDVTVQAVRADAGGSFTSGTGGQDVVISVDPAVADRVIAALALEDPQIRAGVLVGGAATGSPADGAPGLSALPDLSACAGEAPTR
jgi:hypothetical protein